MSEKKLYRVRLVYDGVAAGTDGEAARRAFESAIYDNNPPNPVDGSITPVTNLAQLPEGWTGTSLPYGDDDERAIVDWLYATERLTVRGDPKQVATFLASVRDVAARLGIELVGVPADEKEAKEKER